MCTKTVACVINAAQNNRDRWFALSASWGARTLKDSIYLVSLRDPGQQATNEEESTKEAQPKDFSLMLRLQQRSVRFQFLRPHLLSSKALQQASPPDDGRRRPTTADDGPLYCSPEFKWSKPTTGSAGSKRERERRSPGRLMHSNSHENSWAASLLHCCTKSETRIEVGLVYDRFKCFSEDYLVTIILRIPKYWNDKYHCRT